MRQRKVSWGTQRFCEGVQSFLGKQRCCEGAQSFLGKQRCCEAAKFLGERKGFVRERKVSWGTQKVL